MSLTISIRRMLINNTTSTSSPAQGAMYAPLVVKFVHTKYLVSIIDILYSVPLPDKYQSALCQGLHRNRNRRLVRLPGVP